MNKDEILRRSRNENYDEREFQVLNLAGRVAAIVGMTLCIVIQFLSYAITDSANHGCFAMFFAISAAFCFVKFGYLRKKNDMFMGLLFALMSIVDFVAYVMSVIGG